ncbi:hypothetical protein HPB49_005935 [Dermacentor silvarum]|uniref:Uncharacterized protein n=1 Tax=Dermacentor silvarum TaxID=543639 RepID=A0ACB8DVP4_DERSI|nr:hypothetical protein HPB49_005935 [Dermacentor silvarum]
MRSAEAFRQKFREPEKASNESYAEFAYSLLANMREWLKGAGAVGDLDKVIVHFVLEQFVRRQPEKVRFWVQDRPGVDTIARSAELVEEFVYRRSLKNKIPEG